MRRNVKIMKTKNLPGFALFIIIAVLLSGCGKADTKLESENASLKARVQKLEQQLKEANGQLASPGAQPATEDLKSQLEEAQKKAEASANDLQSLSNQVEIQKQQIDQLTRELSDARQARDKAVKDLQLYQDKAASALKEFQALQDNLSGPAAKIDAYHQNYQAVQAAVTKIMDALPESQVRRQISSVLATSTQIENIRETADLEMQQRTRQAQADFDKFVDLGGLGSDAYAIKLGSDKILAPAEQANAAAAARRDQQIVPLANDLALGIKNLQDLVNGQGA